MKKFAMILVCSVLLGAGMAQAAAFTNGGFENASFDPGGFTTLYDGSTAITGWTVGTSSFQGGNGGSIDYIGSYWQPKEGRRSLDMNGFFAAGAVSQTFDTVAGRRYNVSFDLAGNTDNVPVEKILGVSAGATSQAYTFNSAGFSHGNMGWQDELFSFVATSASTTLAFESLIGGAWGPALDNVSVNAAAVPEPGTIVLLGAGLFGLAIFTKRRNKE